MRGNSVGRLVLAVVLAALGGAAGFSQESDETKSKAITSSIGMKLALIPAGEFMMGSPEDDPDAMVGERPQHRVRITRPFYLGVHEVTQAQYQAVMGENPSWYSANGGGKGEVAGQSTDQHPVEHLSWHDALRFCNKLSEKEGLKPFYEIDDGTARVPDWNGPGYRLPTEAEWEYACRAGTKTRYPFGDDPAKVGESAWYRDNARGTTHPVGLKRPNALGLYDMLGNASEWCWDGYDQFYYKAAALDDPRGPSEDASRAFRGGSWINDHRILRSSCRNRFAPQGQGSILGFRVARGQSSRQAQ
jgi:formylglycine-generating enzyme required for sulfatase activity